MDENMKKEMVAIILAELAQQPQAIGDPLLTPFQEALWGFMKEQLLSHLEVDIDTRYAGMFAREGYDIVVKLKLDNEVVSESVVYLP